MSKFRVGDKVTRIPGCGSASVFAMMQGVKDYYTVTSISPSGCWLGLDNVAYSGDTIPWSESAFARYGGPEDDVLPPAPQSTLYLKENGDRKLRAQSIHGGINILIQHGTLRTAAGYTLEADAALQLAHDLRRMAMDIKRKEKA